MAQRKIMRKIAGAGFLFTRKQKNYNKLFMPLSGQIDSILNDLLSPVLIIDKGLSVMFANNAAIAFFMSALEKNFLAVMPGIDNIVKEFIAKNTQTEIFNEVMIKFDRETCYMRIKISRITENKLMLCLEDISKEVSLRSQLRQAQKMESIGHLTSGIAHDFNNILTVIGGYADLIRKKLEEESLKKYAEQIYISAEKGTTLIRGLLTFSRKNETEYTLCNLNQLINMVVFIFDRMLKENIKLIVIPIKQDIYVMADSIQLEQVIVNMLTNAQDAMPEGGLITITLNTVSAEEIDMSSSNVNEFAAIKVIDSGMGMESFVIEHIFEPFFTTKPPHKGTGLGLPMVQEIVKNHKGKIVCSSVVSEGTTFYIYLPLMSIAKE
ncbi:MAG: hypothetical protein LBH05_06705 [Deferribacteraceae bacterium]|jgi:signal transduction histidine kinase|nr:hypothetical protein [Deferribacteraceae bacterium]